jgi:hypothetical protein
VTDKTKTILDKNLEAIVTDGILRSSNIFDIKIS